MKLELGHSLTDPCPGPDLVDGSKEYEAEHILNSKYW